MPCELVLLFLGEAAVRQAEQLAEAHDGIERGAHLMAHVLHEARLGGIRQHHLLVGFAKPAVVLAQGQDMNHEEGQDRQQDADYEYHHQTQDAQVFLGLLLEFGGKDVVAQARVHLGDLRLVESGDLGLELAHQQTFQLESLVFIAPDLCHVGDVLHLPHTGKGEVVHLVIVETPLDDRIQGLEQFGRGGTDSGERTVAQAVVAVTDIVAYALFVGRYLGKVVLAAERIQMHLRSLDRLVDIHLDGVGPDHIGVGKVAVQTRHTLLADNGILGFPVEIQRLENKLFCGDVVALRYVERYHVADTLPFAVGFSPLDGGVLHFLQEFHGAQRLEVVVEVILDQLIRIVVILGITEFVGDILQVLLHLQDLFVLLLGRKHLGGDDLAGMLEPFHIV